MNLISDQYREQNFKLHMENEGYGNSGARWFGLARDLAYQVNAKSLLDYGCGKGTLVRALNGHGIVRAVGYDPALPQWNALPMPADVVICTDVLEHVEPDCIGDVLDHIKSLALKAFWTYVTLTPSNKMLPDKRNAHLLLMSDQWWMQQLQQRWPGGRRLRFKSDHRLIFQWIREKGKAA